MKHELQNIISGKSQVKLEQLSKQPPITLEMAKAQVIWLKKVTTSKNKKKV
ncbi:hypothetical protein [Flavobacterium sp.]|uniref:hypothetical protein n=1 Tax=Flavobacterium sp. TaxID=239 RepID=UPI003752E486